MLEEELAFSRYAKKLSTLLHCEEAQVEVELHKYDMIATMKRRGASSLVLEVNEIPFKIQLMCQAGYKFQFVIL